MYPVSILAAVMRDLDPLFDPSTVRKYRQRDLMPVSGAEGKGGTGYSLSDLVWFRVMFELNRRWGMDLSNASRIARRAANLGQTRIVGHHRSRGRGAPAAALGFRWLVVTDPERDPELMTAEGVASALFAVNLDPPVSMVIDAVKVVERVKARLRDLGEEVPA